MGTRQLIISDMHFGVRKNSQLFLDSLERFLSDDLFPFLDANPDIKVIKNLGDVFDDRVKQTTLVADAARSYYERLKKRGIIEDLLIGNHDIYYRESNRLNSPEKLLADYIECGTLRPYIETMMHPTDNVLMVPWINKENSKSSWAEIEKSTAPYCFGHFELSGFQVYRNNVLKRGGQDPRPLNKFRRVMTGHFHHRHSYGNINYVGSPTQHNWQDCGDKRGFHTFDMDTNQLVFYPSSFDTFQVIDYDKVLEQLDIDPNKKLRSNSAGPFDKFDFDSYKQMYVRLIYNQISSQSLFDLFAKTMSQSSFDTTVIAKGLFSTSSTTTEVFDIETEDTIKLMREYEPDDQIYDALVDLYERSVALTEE